MENLTLSQLLVIAVIPIIIVLIIHTFTIRKFWKFLEVYSYIAITLLSIIIVFSNCIFVPFSKHDCFCEGYKSGYGSYPINDKHSK